MLANALFQTVKRTLVHASLDNDALTEKLRSSEEVERIAWVVLIELGLAEDGYHRHVCASCRYESDWLRGHRTYGDYTCCHSKKYKPKDVSRRPCPGWRSTHSSRRDKLFYNRLLGRLSPTEDFEEWFNGQEKLL